MSTFTRPGGPWRVCRKTDPPQFRQAHVISSALNEEMPARYRKWIQNIQQVGGVDKRPYDTDQ